MKKLILHDMSFRFNAQKEPFFHDAHIEFDSGAIYFIQGKNGVDKSTFFSLLQGTTPRNASLTGATIFNNDKFIIKNNCVDSKISSQVKTVIQDINKMIVTAMAVEENLRLAHLPEHPRLMPLSHTINLPSIMRGFGINQLDANVQQLSGGQKQILAIMMVLQNQPEYCYLMNQQLPLMKKTLSWS